MDLEAAANEIHGLSLEQPLSLISLSYSINKRKLSGGGSMKVFSRKDPKFNIIYTRKLFILKENSYIQVIN